MASCTAPANLLTFLEQNCERMHKPRSAVLFRRGEKAFGMFLVFSGRVSLNIGIDEALARCYGAGALIGLPATLSKRIYSMTATVIEDAELGFLPPQVLESLMRDNPDLCQELLAILNERMLQIQQLQKILLHKEKQTLWERPGFTSQEERHVSEARRTSGE